MSTEDTKAELLPCPFCAGAGRIFADTSSDYARNHDYVPECLLCGLEGRHCATYGEAVNWWNTRAPVETRVGK